MVITSKVNSTQVHIIVDECIYTRGEMSSVDTLIYICNLNGVKNAIFHIVFLTMRGWSGDTYASVTYVTIGKRNGSAPARRHAITGTIADLL